MAAYDYSLNSTQFPIGGTPTIRYKGVETLTSRVISIVGRAAAANTYPLFDLPAGTVVLGAKLTVIEPANAAGNITVDAGGTACIAAADMTAAAGTVYGAGTEALHVGTVGGNALAAMVVTATQSAATVYTSGKFTVTLVVAGIQ